MSWFRTDDDLPEHVKADALESGAGSPVILAAAWMVWLHMGCDCNRRRTDGAFTRARAERVVRLPPEMIDKALLSLVMAHLLEVTPEGGYQYHDWADYQPTKAELDADRKANTARQKQWRIRQREAREARARNGVTNGVTNGVRNARVSRETTPVTVSRDEECDRNGVPSRPVPSRLSKSESPSGDSHRDVEPERSTACSGPTKADVVRVFEHWRQAMGKRKTARLDSKREARIRWALAEYGMDDALHAIDGCAASSWHRGQNDRGKVYDGLDLIFRDAEHVESFLAGGSGAGEVPMTTAELGELERLWGPQKETAHAR